MASFAAVIVVITGLEHRAPSARPGHIRFKVGGANKILAFLYFHLCFFTLLGAAIVWKAWQPSSLESDPSLDVSLAGQTDCFLCATCHPDATTYGACSAGSTSDVVHCTCNAGFYGSGVDCTRCKTCDPNAATHGTLTVGSCPTGDLPRGINCSCNAGYAGPGTQCSLCNQGTFSTAGYVNIGES